MVINKKIFILLSIVLFEDVEQRHHNLLRWAVNITRDCSVIENKFKYSRPGIYFLTFKLTSNARLRTRSALSRRSTVSGLGKLFLYTISHDPHPRHRFFISHFL